MADKLLDKNMDYDNICRICMKKSNLQSIFQYKIKSGESIDLSHKLKVCCNVDVDINDKLPSHICEECSDGLLLAYDLIVLCKCTDELLRKNIKLKIETPVGEKRTEYVVCFESNNVGCSKINYNNKNSDDDYEAYDNDSDHEIDTFLNSFEDSIGLDDCIEEENKSYYKKPEFAYVSVDKVEKGVGIKTYKCYACELRFPSRWKRELHEDLECPKMPPGSLYECKLCSTTADTRRMYDKHIWLQHKGQPPPRDKEKDLQLTCANTLNDSLCMGLICEVCGYNCKNTSRYKQHRKTHEPKVLHQCAECPYKSTHRYSYILHTRYTHKGWPPIKCEHCPYTTGVKENFKKHMKKHTGERPYACKVCGYRSIDSGNIKKHMVTHTQIKAYKCDICGAAYARNNCLKLHIKQVHENVKRLRCKHPKCKYKCFKQDLLDRHQAERHSSTGSTGQTPNTSL